MALDEAFDTRRFLAVIAEALTASAQSGRATGGHPPDVRGFVEAFFARAGAADMQLHDAATWGTLLRDLLEFAAQRVAETPKVRVFDATTDANGWASRGTVIEIVTDDMPFLVDSVTMAVANTGSVPYAVFHPMVKALRDGQGVLQRLRDDKGVAESIIHLEIERLGTADAREALKARLMVVLNAVRRAVADFSAMRLRLLAIADEVPTRTIPKDPARRFEVQAFLRWLADEHFSFLGYRGYEVVAGEGGQVLQAVPGSSLGILRDSEASAQPRPVESLVAMRTPLGEPLEALIITKTNARSDVHRPGYMDYVGVMRFDASGRPVSEQRFLGLFSSSAYMCRPQDVPVLRRRCQTVMERSGLQPNAYSGKALRHVLEAMPRDELFQSTADELYATASGILELNERPRARLFLRRDRFGRFFSCIVFIPRDRFRTRLRHQVEAMLLEVLHGDRLDSTVLLDESRLARIHITVRARFGESDAVDIVALQTRLEATIRDWHDALRGELVRCLGDAEGDALAERYLDALPAAYVDDVTPEVAAADVQVLATLNVAAAAHTVLYHPLDAPDQLRFKVYRHGGDIALSDVLPQLENLGMRVLTEHVYKMDVAGVRLSIQDLEVAPVRPLKFAVGDVGPLFERAFEHVWHGQAESDNFNRLVLGAFLDWRQVAVVRAYCKYLQQVGIAFSQSYMEDTLNRYPAIANLLVELFNAKFDPSRENMDSAVRARAGKQLRHELEALVPETTRTRMPEFVDTAVAALDEPRAEQVNSYWHLLKVLIADVASLDDERIVRAWMDVVRATTRTGYFQTFDGAPRPYINLKFESQLVPNAPKPVPFREIWVYSPRVEAVHLRFGMVARGGIRWSDRREDFRTEVLGLVKAQMVKNTVIVPVGSKGGFFVKQAPPPTQREAWLAEGKACYELFMDGMLDITDNLVDGKVVAPENVVRHDGDDSYLVVAADKGTAKFSDLANSVATAHHYWLDDAFASGGSHGYDHKAMGITAKGAWESVQQHFRALGHDCQNEDFTCVGIGDMSGDVFGNGMLRSRHTRLVAAFDHRHVFVDPNPDAAATFAERQRMFDLPRSSWDDYDRSLISEGGGIWPRSLKSIPISDAMREVLGLPAKTEHLTPAELISVILKAPVDLLFNGGIGTYVKASTETHAEVGDHANNAVRVDGADLRCKIVGEGGNLGFTQKGRVEAAQQGIALNTDFIDNSAGVDTSDHEVNIKILLNDAVRRGELSFDARNTLLKSMTAEVATLVLADNYRQNQAITLLEHMAVTRLGTMVHFIRTLEAEGHLDRQVAALPDDTELAERKARGQGLTRPELATLLSHDKIRLFDQLLDSDVPEDPYLSQELARYFPEPLRDTYAAHMQRHRLKREIIATVVTNSTINRMGAAFTLRMGEDTGQGPAAITKAFTAMREVLDARALWAGIEALDGKLAVNAQLDATMQVWTLLRHMTRWLLNRPGASLDIAANVERYRPAMVALGEALPTTLTATGQTAFNADVENWGSLAVPADLALQLAHLPVLRAGLDMAEVAHASDQPIATVAKVFFELAEALGLDQLRTQIEALPVEDRWHAQARGSLAEELSHRHRALAVKVLAWAAAGKHDDPVQAWLGRDDATLQHTRAVLAEIMSEPADYPIASVALRRLAQLAKAA